MQRDKNHVKFEGFKAISNLNRREVFFQIGMAINLVGGGLGTQIWSMVHIID